MDIEKLADRLAYYNEWRRGMDGKQPHPVELGADIDEAVSALREIARLRAEIESARVDAERYRFIRGEFGYNRFGINLPCGPSRNKEVMAKEADAAIDAARGEK